MSRTIICKLLQRKAYDILSQKYTVVLLFIGIIIVFVSVLHFGETMMEWSREKYAAVFNPYNDNIGHRSYRSMLCQYVPIDVVYTWVNGTDPKLLQGLATARTEYGFKSSQLNCSFSHCVKSHMVLIKPQLPNTVTLSDLEEIDTAFADITRIFVISTPYSSHHNVSVLVFPSLEAADDALQRSSFIFEDQNFTVSEGYLTDNWLSQNTVSLNDVFMMIDVPSGYSEQQIISKLPFVARESVSKAFIHKEKSLGVFITTDRTAMDFILKSRNVTFENKVASLVAANLIVELPTDHEDVSSSRFTDNEELRYSLRSLEKHAPWVQHIYIITNGQIPHWLNLDNPRISIVSHEVIFPNRSHLPTFSSPAIECHLHRIPNLSRKFLYLNDDVMFGKDVWPEDFYTHTKGQKVYLSWPVPNCAEGCPSSWIRDGYCDKPCNNSQCQWDGGDCTSDNTASLYQGGGIRHEGSIINYFQTRAQKSYCNEDCANTWLADRYCDKTCNIYECGFDAGDCGTESFDKLHEMVLKDTQKEYYMPEGQRVGYFNLTEFINNNHTITEGFYDDHPVARTIAISLKYSVMSIVLYPNHNSTNLTVTLKGEKRKNPFEKIFYLIVSTNMKEATPREEEQSITNGSVTVEDIVTFEEFEDDRRFPKVVKYNKVHDLKFAKVNVSASQLPKHLVQELQELKAELTKGELTEKGFEKKKSEIIAVYLASLGKESANLSMLINELDFKPMNYSLSSAEPLTTNEAKHRFELEQTESKMKNWDHSLIKNYPSKVKLSISHDILRFKDLPSSVSLVASASHLANITMSSLENKSPLSYETSVTRRHLLDTFGDSLRHVNKLYNDAFGYEARKVPSHIAHFVDADVMSRLTDRFGHAFDVTSSHKIRSSNDMQFAFSYYYFLMSETKSVELDELFEMFDTDKSGTWSDREIRTVLTRLNELPLDFSAVNEFEQHIINCSVSYPELCNVLSTPQYERYYDSKLPTVTRDLIKACTPISTMLLQQYSQQKRNKYEIVGEDEVAFKMIHNNLSQVLGQIDDIRKNPKKFICLNDNMEHGTKEAEVIRAVIQDFYESLFPKRSQFELSPDYRNRFLYMNDLEEWRRLRDFIRCITYFCLSLLIIFSVASFWKSEVRPPNHNIGYRHLRHRNVNSFQV